MRITVLNGDMNPGKTKFTQRIESLKEALTSQGHSVAVFHTNKMKIYSCHGCFHCWVKTPGVCVLKDEIVPVHKAVINSDLLLFASPLIMGFTSSSLKMLTDRLIVLLHPYIKLRQGEMHHEKRYHSYPNFGLFLQKEADTDEEDLSIIRAIYERIALNFHSDLKFLSIDQQNEETINEIVQQVKTLEKVIS